MDFDELLNRYSGSEADMRPEELEKALSDTTRNSREFYRCESDRYSVIFEPLSGKAHYSFDATDGGIEQVMSRRQIDYYLNTNYWQPSLPSSGGA